MANNTVNAAANPNLVNQLVDQAMATPEETIKPAELTPPSDTSVRLPSGYVTPTGEVIKAAEVRELTGRDEEALARVSGYARVFNTILSRAVVSVGNFKADDSILDGLLIGDRDALLLGIYKATFGAEVDMAAACQACSDIKTVTVNVDEDIRVKELADPIADSTFTIEGKSHTYLVTLPTGVTQKELINAEDKNSAEVTSVLLENTVLEIDGRPVVSPLQIKNIGLLDRRKIVQEIADRAPGPKFEAVKVTCPDCGGEVVVPISFGALFRF
jgi:hypothetical protein